MKSAFIGTLLLLLSSPFFSQTEIGGIINKYAKVLEIDPCAAILTTATTPIFNVGDEVLLIQMQGAEINESNSDDFGDITNLGGAGLFERNEILDIVGTQVFLKYNLANNYDASGGVQLVDIPNFNSATVVEELNAFAWNGDFGGVLTLRASSLTLDANIDVSEQGFRGGAINVVNSDCGFFTNADDYHYDISNWRGAPKGEGIAQIIEGKEQGRGPQANGGGGGNDHNSGGGGGANLTQAGEGGKQSVGGFGCDGDFPGERGKALENLPNRIFMGGGGGAGHVNNAGVGTPGGNGGGIVLLFVDVLNANGFSILSNGETPNNGAPSASDGQGGGGAGGTIILDIEEFSGLNLEANGGNGGSVNNPSDRCFGPGGGGSGGRLMSSISILNVNLLGGQPGVNTNPSGQCSDPSNSADEGTDGFVTDFEGIPFTNMEVAEVAILAQPVSNVVCAGDQITFNFMLSGPNLNYVWQFDDGSGWQDVQPGPMVTGFNTNSLTFFQTETNMDGWQVRCFVTGPCTEDILSQSATLTVLPELVADFSFVSLGGGAVQFTNLSGDADSYFWDFGDTLTSTDENPEHTYAQFGQYTVSLTITGDCGEATFSQVINVAAPPNSNFSSSVTAGCAPLIVQFFNESSSNAESWEWHFPGGFPSSSTDENPGVEYINPGFYDVTLISTNDEGSDTLTLTAYINAQGAPLLDFTTDVDLLTVQFVNLSQNATGGFLWDFGDTNTSTEENPEHTYATEGFFDVTLTSSNDCGESTFTQTIATGQFPLAGFAATNNGGCAPTEINFNDLSSGTNLSGWQWQFEGGVPATSLEQNPTVTYTEPGTYDVTLTVFNAFGEHTTLEEDFVVVEAFPEPDFTYSTNGAAVAFMNNSVGGVSYFWDFGDNQTSSAVNPFHIYDSPGLYEVVLTVLSDNCGSSIAKDVFIEGPNAVGEIENERHVLVFPNPTDAELNVKLSYLPAANAQLRLINLDGKLLRQKRVTEAKTTLDISDLLAGIYILEVTNQNQSTGIRIVKQ